MSKFDIEEVLQQLTLEEKIKLLAGNGFFTTHSVQRLGIPSLNLSDGPNGVRGSGSYNPLPGAVLPNSTALSATFDQSLFEKSGKVIGVEAHHKSVHVSLGPTTNIQRGPNGGRGFESFSEDPFLAGKATAGVIKGIQGEQVAATVKHFVGNDLEHERNSSDSLITPRALREIYLEPFRLAVKYANPKAIMTGYNKVNGEHVSQSKFFLKELLRDEWKWDGCVISDWFGTYTARDGIENGLDLEMPGPPKFRTKDVISTQIGSRELHIKHVDDRVRGVLSLVKFALESGIPENGPEDVKNNTPETASTLREISANSIVLLKNEDNVLPLSKDENVAVIGPNAKEFAYSGGGSASLIPYYVISPYEGICNKLGKEPPYTIGATGFRSLPGLGDQLKNPVTGEKGFHLSFYDKPFDSEGRTKFDDDDFEKSYYLFHDYEHEALNGGELFYIDFEGIFVPEETSEYDFSATVVGTAQIFVDDQLIVDNKTKQTKGVSFYTAGTVEERGRIHLEAGKQYKVRVEFGSGPTSTYGSESGIDHIGKGGIQIGGFKVIDSKKEIQKAVELAKSVDKVILVVGLNGEWESEAFDRPDLSLPGYTNDLVEAIIATNPNTVIVNQSGTPVEFPWLSKAKALVQAWFGGNELGNAIADVLYGDVNPSGKLPLTFPLRLKDNPTYLNFRTERGRVLYGEDIFVGYRFYEKLQRKVAFPFGYGLSYTTFGFSDLVVSADEANNKVSVQVKVTNTGSVTGKEVVQVYVSKSESDVIRPVKELKGFEKVELTAGESKVVKVELELKDAVSFFDEYQNQWSVQSGEYQIQVGPCSDDIELIGTFDVKKGFFWSGL